MISIKKIRVSLNKRKNCLPKCPYHSLTLAGSYSNPKSFVNFLLPPRTRGEGWGGVKNLQLLQGLLYLVKRIYALSAFLIKSSSIWLTFYEIYAANSRE